MANNRLLEAAERWKNDKISEIIEPKKQADSPVEELVQEELYPNLPSDVFILSYDGDHKDFAQELIAENNKLFSGTQAQIQNGTTGEVPNMDIVKRLGLVTTIYKNSQLQSANLLPITPTQSEFLLSSKGLINVSNNWEDLALILHDHDNDGKNSQEAKALYQEILKYKSDLNLNGKYLEKRLVVVNAGIIKSDNTAYGVLPIVLPGLTQVYPYEPLYFFRGDYSFDYGLVGGLPSFSQVEKGGNRTLHMPLEIENIGLRVLCRHMDSSLSAKDVDFVCSGGPGRVHFASQTPLSKGGIKLNGKQ